MKGIDRRIQRLKKKSDGSFLCQFSISLLVITFEQVFPLKRHGTRWCMQF